MLSFRLLTEESASHEQAIACNAGKYMSMSVQVKVMSKTVVQSRDSVVRETRPTSLRSMRVRYDFVG